MNPLWIVGAMAAGALWIGGYLLAARRGRGLRDELALAAQAAQVRAQRAEAARQAQAQGLAQVDRALSELQSMASGLAGRDDTLARIQHQLSLVAERVAEGSAQEVDIEGQVRRALAPLAGKAQQTQRLEKEIQRVLAAVADGGQAEAVQRAVAEALDPVLAQEKLAERLRAIPSGRHRGDLPRILDAISQRAGLSALVLSDAEGLAVGWSSSTDGAERLAAVAAAYLTLADRYQQLAVPVPQAFVARDASHQAVMHRIFALQGTRYVLSAVTKGHALSPHALDAALDKIEHALGRERWTA